MSTPIALTIAGSDPSGGAGIQADLKTFGALGVYGAAVLTAATVQNTCGVTAIHDIPANFIGQQIDAVCSDLAVNAGKVGMLSQPAAIEAVAAALRRHTGFPVVFDPVMVATSGDRLLAPEAIDVLRRALIPLALLITPNLPEAAVLLGEEEARTETEVRSQGERLLALGARAVLIKGGHQDGPESVDFLVDGEGAIRLAAPRVATRNTHGTGCTLSSAVAAGLAQGMRLRDAVAAAKAYVTAAIVASDRLKVGAGNGPVHHFHALWPT